MYERLPRMSQLAAFQAVAETLNFREAARRLGVSPSSVTRSVKELEELLGLQLVSRGSSGVFVTEAGRRLLGQASSAVEITRSLVGEAKGLQGGAPSAVSCGITSLIARTILQAGLQRVFSTFPRAKLDVEISPFRNSIERMKKGTLDFAIGNRVIAVPPEFTALPLMRVPFCPCCSADNPLRETRSFDELREASWVISGTMENLMRQFPERFRIRPRQSVRMLDLDATGAFVGNSGFISMMTPAHIAASRGRAVRIEIPGFPAYAEYVLAYPRQRPRSAVAERLIAALLDEGARFDWGRFEAAHQP